MAEEGRKTGLLETGGGVESAENARKGRLLMAPVPVEHHPPRPYASLRIGSSTVKPGWARSAYPLAGYPGRPGTLRGRYHNMVRLVLATRRSDCY